MKQSLLAALLIVMMTCGLAFVDHARFGRAENSLNTSNATPLQQTTPTQIAPTSKDIYSTPHSLLVKLPNGTLCTAFDSNLLGTNFNDAVYVSSSNNNGASWGTPTKISNFSQTTTTTSLPNGTIKTINSEPNQGSLGTVIASDTDNNVYVAWSGFSYDDSVWQIWCATYNGSAWSTPVKVSRGLEPRLNSQSLSIAVDRNNKVHIVWDTSMNGNETHNYEHNKIFYAQYDGTWSEPQLISAQPYFTPFFQFSPSIAVDSENNLHVVWAGSNDQSSNEGDLWYAKYKGAWQVPVKLTTTTFADMSVMYLQAPAIAVDSNNNLHIVWQGAYDQKYRTDQIWYLNYTTSPSIPIIISYVPLMNSSDQQNPSIAIDANNRILVIWMSKRESVLFYSRCYNSSWSNPVQVEEYSSAYPHLRWSTFPASNTVTTKLDYIFSRGPTLMFNSLSPIELPSGPPYSVSITPVSEIVSVGQSLRLTSSAISGHPPYKYQWYINGTPVSGATSNSWIFKPTTSGIYSVIVSVTDSVNNTVNSGPAQVEATTEFVQGSFGYIALSGEAQGGSSYIAYGSRFTLRVEANITSMSALISEYPPPSYGNPNFSYSPTFDYRFAIYNDNNNSIGNIIAQTALGTALVGAQYQELFNTANFPSPVHLTPGIYWLMEVVDAPSGQLNINGPQTNDYNESIYANIGGMTFPNYISPTQQWLGHLYCIYASWEMNGSKTVSQNQNLFAITSNSTVSSLAYNSANRLLSFTVSGSNGTTGYADIYISKTLLQNLSELSALLDGNPMNFTSSSIGNFWVLHFSYTHSTHKVNISFSTQVVPEFPSWIILPALLVSATFSLKQRKKP